MRLALSLSYTIKPHSTNTTSQSKLVTETFHRNMWKQLTKAVTQRQAGILPPHIRLPAPTRRRVQRTPADTRRSTSEYLGQLSSAEMAHEVLVLGQEKAHLERSVENAAARIQEKQQAVAQASTAYRRDPSSVSCSNLDAARKALNKARRAEYNLQEQLKLIQHSRILEDSFNSSSLAEQRNRIAALKSKQHDAAARIPPFNPFQPQIASGSVANCPMPPAPVHPHPSPNTRR